MESVDSKFGDAPRPRPWDHFAAACGHMQLCFASMSRCGMPKPDLPKYTTMPLLSHRLSGEQEIPWIMKPTGSRKKTWDLFVMALILYSALAVPVRVCFHAHAEGVVWVFEAIMSLVFVVDVFLAFNTAYSTEGGWETRHKHIASRYLLSWFWVDVPSAIPIELIEVVLHPSRQTDEMLSTLRFLRMFRLFRLLRLLKLSEYIARIEEAFMINLRVLKLVGIFVKLGYIAHFLGCGFFFMHTLADEEEPTWISEYDGGSAIDGPLSKQYLYSIYWSLTTMSTVGYGDITPANDRERWFATFSLVVGALSFAFINGSVVGVLSTLDNQTSMVEEKLQAVHDYVQWRSLPKDLVIRIRRYYEHYYTRSAVFDEADILHNLNPQLEAEVVNYIIHEQLRHLPLFSKLNPSFKIELFPHLKPISFAPGDTIYRKGAPSRTIYFLLSGEIDVYRGVHNAQGSVGGMRRTSLITPLNEIDTSSGSPEIPAGTADWTGHNPLAHLSAGGEQFVDGQGADIVAPTGNAIAIPTQGIFGQAALLGRRREATLVARTNCEALLIAKEDLRRLFERDALSARRVCTLVLEDFLKMDRLSMLALRLRLISAPKETELRAALIMQYHWRRYNDLLARANDPIYELIDKETGPQNLTHEQRWQARSVARPGVLPGHATSRNMAKSSHNLLHDAAGTHRQSAGPAKGGGGEADVRVLKGIAELKEMYSEIKLRLDRLEENTPRRGKSKSSGGSGSLSLMRGSGSYDGGPSPPPTA